MEDCEHLFVRYRLGAFICDYCGQAFEKMPSEMAPRKSESAIISFVKAFIQGDITYGEALQGTGLENKEFRDYLSKLIPKKFITQNCYTLGQEGGVPIVVGVEPHRTSDPQLIDSFFSASRNGFVSKVPGDIIKIAHDQFPDIKSLDVEVNTMGTVVCMITFVDDTQQRVHLQ